MTRMKMEDITNEWKVDTPALLNEIMNNDQVSILKIPIRLFVKLLSEVVQRAIELDDVKLNKLMIRLALFEGVHTKKVLDYLKVDDSAKIVPKLFSVKGDFSKQVTKEIQI